MRALASVAMCGALFAGCITTNLHHMAAQAEADYGCSAQVGEQIAETIWQVQTCDGVHHYTGDEQFGYWEVTNGPGATPGSSGSRVEVRGGGPVHVGGYYRRDGTYVHPHTRRRPH